jgi:hypothetical protein
MSKMSFWRDDVVERLEKAAQRYLNQSEAAKLLTAKDIAHREHMLLHRISEERMSRSYGKSKPLKGGQPLGPSKPRRKPNAAA